MVRRHYITLLLLFVSLLTLAVPVMPHHHHSDGNICLRHDLATMPGGHSHCCHNQGCVATHYFQREPVIVRQHLSADQMQRLVTNFAMLFLGQSTAFYSCPSYSPYVEFLHGMYIAHAKGRRAPPIA